MTVLHVGEAGKARWRVGTALLMVLAAACGGCSRADEALDETLAPAIELRDVAPGPIAMRRLTRDPYVATLRGVFGDDLKVLPPTEVDVAVEGLLTVGGKVAAVTPAGMEGYLLSARQVAAAALAPDRRAAVVPCAPVDEAAADDACARAFVESLAPLLLRRAVRPEEVTSAVGRARAATVTLGGFWAGLASLLVGWLISPEFLFIQERAGADAGDGSGARLTPEALASRLSYFVWGRGPDLALLQAAADGPLLTEAGHAAQVDRLLADGARLERGVRALFTDLLGLAKLASVDKDDVLFPAFTAAAVEDARAQTLRTVVDHLLTRRADDRDLFTTRKTFMSRHLGPIDQVPVVEDWQSYEFSPGGARAAVLHPAARPRPAAFLPTRRQAPRTPRRAPLGPIRGRGLP